MKICPNCNASIEDTVTFCGNCGTNVANVHPQTPPVQPHTPPVQPQTPPVQPQTPPVEPQFNQQYSQSRKINVPHLVWGILDIVLMFFSIPSVIMGIIAIVSVASATCAATDEEEAAKIKTARNLNIAATIVAAVLLILFVALIIVLAYVFADAFSGDITKYSHYANDIYNYIN